MSEKRTPQQLAFILIHYWTPVIEECNWETQKAWVLMLDETLKRLTPLQFAQVFPITKEYKGHTWGSKDYYTVTDWIGDNVGWNNKIPDGIKFLLEYLNINVQLTAVRIMNILGKFHQRQTGSDLLIDFLKSQGAHIRFTNLDEEDQ
ncbi:hypothetical protein [Limosilactobacillus reuteri]|uniref:hypothetical protein n=1 Tax=Limosilactobacillus reuteri TaxID=1598 RepID=UPI001E4A227A|nr:hypothetical protein [Limosilactobacillus reuteri]UFK66305.1 hypothetical protein IU404_01748 [Limosilactobacillus reuteri]UFK67425.1 hypothetical protein IVR12_00383 [Limosilactobacillus reuteri]